MKLAYRTTTEIEPGTLRRPACGPVWNCRELSLPLQGLPGWQSHGGPDSHHPDGTRPCSLEVIPPHAEGLLTRVHILGVFAIHACYEQPGTLGATITVGTDRQPIGTFKLLNGRHYSDALDLRAVHRLTGDGASIETVGHAMVDGQRCRVDLMTLDVAKGSCFAPIRFRDLGTPASFVIFDVLYEFSPAVDEPFRSESAQLPLSELAAIVRVGDRLTLRRAIDQLEDNYLRTADLDEVRAAGLGFIAVVIAAMIEMGDTRPLHRLQLEAARRLDALSCSETILAEIRCVVEDVVASMGIARNPSELLVDRALSFLNRHFAEPLTDSFVADQLNVSTPHFRFLFKELTGQPFHKYLIALRLERGRKLLLESDMPIGEVAASVGFGGIGNFTRAFTRRFAVSPTNLRRNGVTVPE